MPDLISQLLHYSEGEGIDDRDLVRAQRMAWAMLLDGALAGLTRTDPEENAPGPLYDTLYALGSAGAPRTFGMIVLPVSTALQVILQRIAGGFDGLEPKYLPWVLDGSSEGSFTCPAADPNFDRLDSFAVKLEMVSPAANPDPFSPMLAGEEIRDFEDAVTRAKSSRKLQKRAWVKATWDQQTGTPALNPVLPTHPAGFARWAAVRVRAAAITLSDQDLYDYRFPVGLFDAPVVIGQGMIRTALWTVGATGELTAGAAAQTALAILPSGPWRNGRLLRLRWQSTTTGATDLANPDCRT